MNALDRHLRTSASHDHLAFHPACARCRHARLAGQIAGHPVVPTRLRAGVAAAVIGAMGLASGVRHTEPARAQTTGTTPSDTTPMVSPEELDKRLADPNRPDPKPRNPARGPRGSVLVRPGDSLWTIAHHELGGTPTAARIAGEVDRLWRLNAASIGTGDRDLIYPGQRLRLG